jgi:hypothetical protein
VAALAAAVADGAVTDMQRPHPGQSLDTVVARLARSMQDHRAIDPAMASWAMSVWAGALGLPADGGARPAGSDGTGPTGLDGAAARTERATLTWGALPPPPFPPSPLPRVAASAPAKNRGVLFAALAALGLLLLVAAAFAISVPTPDPGPHVPPTSTPTTPTTPPTQPARHGALGLQLDDGPNDGAVITGFNGNGPGAQSGLRVGDEIVEVDGAQINGAQDLIDRIHGMSPGTIVELTVLRNGAVLHGRVTLASAG